MTESAKSDPFAHLIISRKRKQYKFAHFDSYPNCFAFARGDDPVQIRSGLGSWTNSSKPVVLEIAAGNAQFSLELARRHPDVNFIAADIKSDRLYTSAKQALAEDIGNIAFVRINMLEIDKIFEPSSLGTIWLTFPDPFSRKRSVRRRLTHPQFLSIYSKLLDGSGQLKFKTDSRELFMWSLEQFVAQEWRLSELSFDLHESELPDDYKVMTHYEQRFTQEGIPINLVSTSL